MCRMSFVFSASLSDKSALRDKGGTERTERVSRSGVSVVIIRVNLYVGEGRCAIGGIELVVGQTFLSVRVRECGAFLPHRADSNGSGGQECPPLTIRNRQECLLHPLSQAHRRN